jgi:hypothetical protein
MLDWSQCTAVERTPGKVSGAWLFKGTRVPMKCCDTPNRASKSHSLMRA